MTQPATGRYCADCGKELTRKRSIRCRSCADRRKRTQLCQGNMLCLTCPAVEVIAYVCPHWDSPQDGHCGTCEVNCPCNNEKWRDQCMSSKQKS